MKYKTYIIILLLALIGCKAHAQESTLRGTVTDSITGEGLPYASLIYRGTLTGTATDDEGRYQLPSPEKAHTLEVSYLGYITKQIALRPHQEGRLDIRLAPDDIALQEVTVKPKKERYSKKDNPAVQFVKQVIARRGSNSPKNKGMSLRKMSTSLNISSRNCCTPSWVSISSTPDDCCPRTTRFSVLGWLR